MLSHSAHHPRDLRHPYRVDPFSVRQAPINDLCSDLSQNRRSVNRRYLLRLGRLFGLAMRHFDVHFQALRSCRGGLHAQ